MKKKLLTFAAVLGLFVGGFSTANYFKSIDISNIRDSELNEFPDLAESITRKALVDGASAAQVTQVQSEVSVQLQYMQVRQNAEIIRLLTELNKKK